MNIIVGWIEVLEEVHFWLAHIVTIYYLGSLFRVHVVSDFVAWCLVSITKVSYRAEDNLCNFYFFLNSYIHTQYHKHTHQNGNIHHLTSKKLSEIIESSLQQIIYKTVLLCKQNIHQSTTLHDTHHSTDTP